MKRLTVIFADNSPFIKAAANILLCQTSHEQQMDTDEMLTDPLLQSAYAGNVSVFFIIKAAASRILLLE